MLETPQRIEPARLEDAPEAISDAAAELAAASARLGNALHPRTAAQLAGLVRIMNSYYSNLIEGHNTRPRDIERALAGDFESDGARRDLQAEAAAHVRLQAEIDRLALEDELPEPASGEFVCWLHREFYRDASAQMLTVSGSGATFVMEPGVMRAQPAIEVSVGRHLPPSSKNVAACMAHFEARYRLAPLGKVARILAIPAAHHRFNFIHPFADGNGRVSRLMSHAMAHKAGIAAGGLWSISRGLARGLESRGEYLRMMDHADMPRQGDLDGRGTLSQRALSDYVMWFLRVCIDQIAFMESLFELDKLRQRIRNYVERHPALRGEALHLLEAALVQGQVGRGEFARITGLPERTARRVFNEVAAAGLLASDTPKGPVSLRFPVDTLDILFPRLFAQA